MSDVTVMLEFIILILCISIVVLSKSGDRVESGSLAVYKIHQYYHLEHIIGDYTSEHNWKNTAFNSQKNITARATQFADSLGISLSAHNERKCLVNYSKEWANEVYSNEDEKRFTADIMTCVDYVAKRFYMTYETRIDLVLLFLLWTSHSFMCHMLTYKRSISDENVDIHSSSGKKWWATAGQTITWVAWSIEFGAFVYVFIESNLGFGTHPEEVQKKFTDFSLFVNILVAFSLFLTFMGAWFVTFKTDKTLKSDVGDFANNSGYWKSKAGNFPEQEHSFKRVSLDPTFIPLNAGSDLRNGRTNLNMDSILNFVKAQEKWQLGWIALCFVKPLIVIPVITLIIFGLCGITEETTLVVVGVLSIILSIVSSVVSYYNLYCSHRTYYDEDTETPEEPHTKKNATDYAQKSRRPANALNLTVSVVLLTIYALMSAPKHNSRAFWSPDIGVIMYVIVVGVFVFSDFMIYGRKSKDDAYSGFVTALNAKGATEFTIRVFILLLLGRTVVYQFR